MKILSIDNLIYELPKGFKGGLSAALRSLAYYNDHHRRIKTKTHAKGGIHKQTTKAFNEVRAKGRRLAACLAIQKLNPDGKTWRKCRL